MPHVKFYKIFERVSEMRGQCYGFLPSIYVLIILPFFHVGRLGPIALQFAPEETNESEDEYNVEKNMKRGVVDYSAWVSGGGSTLTAEDDWQSQQLRQEQERQELAKAAVELAKEKGLELPPMVQKQVDQEEKETEKEEDGSDSGSDIATPEIGKGLFDGW